METEKERLSNFMAFGEDVKPKSREQILKEKRAKDKEKEEAANVDRFDESKWRLRDEVRFSPNAR